MIASRATEIIADVRTDLRRNAGHPPLDAETIAVFTLATVLLTVFHYYGKSGAWWVLPFAPAIETALDLGPAWRGILPYAWWGICSVVLRVAIPLVVMRWLFDVRPRDYGFTLRGTLQSLPVYGVLYLVMLPFLWGVAQLESFQRTYPFWEGAREGGLPFWTFEALYALQFVGVEFFFRGFLGFALVRKFGYAGLFIATVPYVMIHFNKPVSETLGALVAGLVLGWLAIRSRTIVPGILLHGGIALTMDLLSLRAAAA